MDMSGEIISPYETRQNPISIDDRLLSAPDNINQNRLPDGTIPGHILKDVKQNLITATQEASMPFAVTTTKHEYLKSNETGEDTFMWLGKTAIQNAMSGYTFHKGNAAFNRVDIEVDEARYSTENVERGIAKVFISPRMTSMDATKKEAEIENLAEEDSIRVSWPEFDKKDNITGRVMQSMLIKDIPYESWIKMLKDKNNIFGKSIDVDEDGSALSIMKIHRELDLPIVKVPNGPVDIAEAVIDYVDDEKLRTKLKAEIKKYYFDQDKMQEIAEKKADDWLEFDIELANSLKSGVASFEIERFITVLQHRWSEEDLKVINSHFDGNTYKMTRELAYIVEGAKQNLLWTGAAVLVDNPELKRQLSNEVLVTIRQNEELIMMAKANGMNYYELEAQNQRLISKQNVEIGGGCPGKSKTKFRIDENDPNQESTEEQNDSESQENWKWKQGVCRVKSCGKKTEVGPCNVCRSCQKKFDSGVDPTKEVPKVQPEVPKAVNNIWKIIEMGIEKNNIDTREKISTEVKNSQFALAG